MSLMDLNFFNNAIQKPSIPKLQYSSIPIGAKPQSSIDSSIVSGPRFYLTLSTKQFLKEGKKMGDRLSFLSRRGFLKRGLFLLGTFMILSMILSPLHAEARNIKVGILDTYSGPPAMFSKEALNGFKLALEDINKKGVLGNKIEFTTRDSKFKVDIGLSMAKELVMRENVDVIVGIISSGVAMAVSDYARREKVPLIVWIAKSERITGEKGHRYVFSTGENTAMHGKAAGVALSRKPFIKYWIAGDDYEYGHAIAESAWRNITQQKPEVKLIGQSWWKVGEPDLVPYFTAILSAKPDAVIFATGGASMVNAMKTANTTGLSKKAQVWVPTATETAILRALGAGAPEGIMGSSDYLFNASDSQANRAFVLRQELVWQQSPSTNYP